MSKRLTVCAWLLVGAFLAFLSTGALTHLATGRTATIGGNPVPALTCTEDSVIALMPGGVRCVHVEGLRLEP